MCVLPSASAKCEAQLKMYESSRAPYMIIFGMFLHMDPLVKNLHLVDLAEWYSRC